MEKSMSEVIKAIREVQNYKPGKEDYWEAFDGFEVETDKQKIYVLIRGNQLCCEEWGYLSTPDDQSEFIGARLLSIAIVDQALQHERLEKACDSSYRETMFVNFETDKGTFQLTAYNAHNGYYGHDVRVISKQFNYEGTL